MAGKSTGRRSLADVGVLADRVPADRQGGEHDGEVGHPLHLPATKAPIPWDT